MHRVVGDRTRALAGALTVAGLCRDLTGFATTRRDWLSRPLYHPTTELPDRRPPGDLAADKPLIRVAGHDGGLALLPPPVPTAGGGQPS
jgi:hypothetical protein